MRRHILVPVSQSEMRQNKLPLRATLWRYLTGEKINSLMESGEFWFSRIDQFMGDLGEGRRPQSSLLSASERNFFADHNITSWSEQYPGATDEQRTHYFALCWHINDRENARMWRDYCGDSRDSVAIVTSHKAMWRWRDEIRIRQLWLGPVAYRKPTDAQPRWRYEDQFFYKDCEEFGWEREFRILTTWHESELPGPELSTLEAKRRMVPFNLNRDVHRVVFHPKAPADFKADFRKKAKKVFRRLKRVEDSVLTNFV